MKLQIVAIAVLISVFCGNMEQDTKNTFQKPSTPYVASAKSYIVMEAKTANVILSENYNKKLPMASTTKIMTALIALEQANIDEPFLIDENAIKVEGTSMGLQIGDKVSLRTLAVGMLMQSGNDAANAVAVKIAGSTKQFAAIMNLRAKEIGMVNTNFVTPSGLHDENHYSTAKDMALLTSEALKNKDFLDICSKSSIKVEFSGKDNQKKIRTYKNHNRLVDEIDGCVGVKTGFTKKAGRCLVSATKRDDITLICVTLSASNDWELHKFLYNAGFKFTKKTKIITRIDDIKIQSAEKNGSPISVESEEVFLPSINQKDANQVGENSEISQQICLPNFYYLPIKNGDVLGEIRYYYKNREIGVANVKAKITD